MECKGRVAIVTGAAGSGMGRSIALTLAREGARVAVNYLTSEDSASRIVEQIRSTGGEAIAVQADIFTAKGCEKLVLETRQGLGECDICIVGPGGGWTPEPIHQLDAGHAIDDIRSEVAPILHLMPLLLPGMMEREWGRFIGIGMNPMRPSPSYVYNAAKGARTQALLQAHEEAWKKGVTFNVIAPGPVPQIDGLDEAIEQCQHGASWKERTNVSPQDVAEGVAFLCSDPGRFISGCILPYQFH